MVLPQPHQPHQCQQHRKQLQRQARSSNLLFIYLIVVSWLCTSAQAVLTEDDIIKKELAWVAKTRKAYEHGFFAGPKKSKHAEDEACIQLRQQKSVPRDVATGTSNEDGSRGHYNNRPPKRPRPNLRLRSTGLLL
jgi:hypothetical protein